MRDATRVEYDGPTTTYSIALMLGKVVCCLVVDGVAVKVGIPDVGFWRMLLVAAFLPHPIVTSVAGAALIARFAGWSL